MKRLAARFAQPASLMILSCTILFGLPFAVGLLGMIIGAAALFIPTSWEA
ncbi:hypothetical protein [Brevundimonas sp. UBA2416]|jgi:hypothetical protein|nr:hypothetical protein [Brevundimonas sp. UBA2416]HRJ63253.1 hypothetical protein [Brevundimonas sp.]